MLFSSKKHLFSITLSLLSVWGLMAQKAPIEYGKLSEEEINMKQYDPDTTASAVILCDYGYTHFSYSNVEGPLLIFEKIKRIKIFKKEAFDYANIFIPYYEDYNGIQRVEEVKAHSYNVKDGILVETPMEKTGQFDGKFDSKFYNKKFAIPEVKEGSIIEYSYRITSDFFASIPSWAFQFEIPVVHSEYRLSVPDFLTFAQISQGPIPEALTVSTHGIFPDMPKARVVNYQWVMNNIPKLESENYISSLIDFETKIYFQIKKIEFPDRPIYDFPKTWNEFSAKFMSNNNFGGAINTKKGISKLVAPLIKNVIDTKDKMNLIYDYVIGHFRSDGSYNYNPKMKQSMADLLESKKGSASEINLLLIAMLRNADIEAFPVIISTRPHGKLKELFPLVENFDYTLACVILGEDKILLDASDPLRPPGLLPEIAMNGQGVLLKEINEYEIIPIRNSVRSTYFVNANIEIRPDGSMDEQLLFNFKGYPALTERYYLGKVHFDTRLHSILKEELEEGTLIESNVEHEDDPSQTLVYNCHLQSAAFNQVSGSNQYLSPFLSFKHKTDLVNAETRKLPIDLGSGWDESFVFNIKIPDGYKISELPKAKRLQWEDGALKFDFLVDTLDNQIKLSNKLSVKRTNYEVEEYAQLRDFFRQVASKESEQIVLEKQ